jgi:glycosyltransferase involved in cell wall biosynthesis
VRILHVVPTYVPAWGHGGPIVAVHGLCRALRQRGHSVDVFTTNVSGDGFLDVPLDDPVDIDGVAVRYFSIETPRRLYYSPRMKTRLRQEVGHMDVVHVHSVFLWPTTAAAREAERQGIPWIVAPRGMLVSDLFRRRGWLRKKAWIWLAESRTLGRAAALHATSELEAHEARALGLRLPPVAVIPNGVEFEPPPTAPAENAQVRTACATQNLLLFLGRLSWKKGLDRLIAALAAIPQATLALAGNDEENYTPTLERLATEAGVRERVMFLGPVFGNDKSCLLHAAAVLVLPSYSENFGNVVLEAMAAGCPVVVTPEVGVADTVARTGCGVVVDGQPTQLGAELARLLADPDLRAGMGKRGAETAQREFSWPVIASHMEALYQRVSTSRGGA